MASVSELACTYSAVIVRAEEMTVPEDRSCPAGGPAPATAAAAAEKKVRDKKEETEESDDDMGFGLSKFILQ
ncbi:large ribosomal subunit protein P1-like [Ochotona princeps]|uniref:large ribosomal subunit protein P1-like n=1 Tax=Ochotona princeps TaxID=9978 RepID=UPI00271550D6|nr:large ribosomal subunit protein P1-like [Ochotona princeps]